MFTVKIQDVFAGGRVKRYHTHDTINIQNNAEHSWGVASLMLLIDPEVRKEVLLHALWHDVAEAQTGDLPATAKWRWPKLKKVIDEIEDELERKSPLLPPITDREKGLLKICDRLESILFCMRERKIGNDSLDHVIKNCIEKILEANEVHNFPMVNKILIEEKLR